jgi:hypothetical protein
MTPRFLIGVSAAAGCFAVWAMERAMEMVKEMSDSEPEPDFPPEPIPEPKSASEPEPMPEPDDYRLVRDWT